MSAEVLLKSWLEATLATALLALLIYGAGRRWLSARWLYLGWSVVLLKLLMPPLFFITLWGIIPEMWLQANQNRTDQIQLTDESETPSDSNVDVTVHALQAMSITDGRIETAVETGELNDEIQLKSNLLVDELWDRISTGNMAAIALGAWAFGVLYHLAIGTTRMFQLVQLGRQLKLASIEDKILLKICQAQCE